MLAEFNVTPIGAGVSVSNYVADAIKIVDESELDYKIGPMGTVVEGELNEVLELIKNCHKAVMEKAERVATTIFIDDRKGYTGRITKKVESVENKVGRALKK